MKTRPFLFVALIALAALVIAGCGSSDDADTSTDAAADASSAQVEEPEIEVLAGTEGKAAAAAKPVKSQADKPIDEAVKNATSTDVVDKSIEAAGGADAVIEQGKSYTVFMPSDVVLGGIPQEKVDEALQAGATGDLARMLRSHIVEGVHKASTLKPGQSLTTLADTKITIGGTAKQLTVNGFPIKQRDVASKNGIIHVIDGMLSEDASSQ